MTAVRREHTGAAAATTLVAQLTAGATTFSITDATGWPTGAVGPFVVTVGAGTATEERILCLSRTTTTITVSSRGWEGTADQLHAAASEVIHSFSATEADEANIAAVAVAGITGSLVGTGGTQTLTGKTLTSPTINSPIVATPTVTGGTYSAPALTAPTASGDLSGFGGAWTAYTPTLTNFTGTVIEARYSRVGKTVRVQGQINLTAAPTGPLYVSAPVTPRAADGTTVVAGSAVATDTGTAVYGGVTFLDTSASRFSFLGFGGSGSGANADVTVPFTWGSPDVLRFDATYEAA